MVAERAPRRCGEMASCSTTPSSGSSSGERRRAGHRVVAQANRQIRRYCSIGETQRREVLRDEKISRRGLLEGEGRSHPRRSGGGRRCGRRLVPVAEISGGLADNLRHDFGKSAWATSCFRPRCAVRARTQQVRKSIACPSLPEALAAGIPVLADAGMAAAGDALSTTATVAEPAFSIPGVVGDSPLREGFAQALLLILFSELGDKTFFIAILLATQRDKAKVFAGTFGALAVMTVISVGLGRALHSLDELLPISVENFDDYLAVALLLFFGVQTLIDANSGELVDEEEKEAEEAVEAFDDGGGTALLISTFALVFAAEWGDKSFLATIALAAASSPVGVVAGAVVGHGIATGIAVLGGSILGKYVTPRAVSYAGGILFIVFAIATLVDL